MRQIDNKQHLHKPVCLWIHGWGMSAAVWSAVPTYMPHEQFEHRWISFAQAQSIDDLKQAMRDQLRSLPVNSVMIGWSMGAMLMIDVIAEELRVNSGYKDSPLPRLIIISSTLSFTHQNRNQGWPQRIVKRMRDQLSNDQCGVLTQFIKQMWSERDTMKFNQQQSELRNVMEQGRSEFSLRGLEAGLDYLMTADLHEAWEQIISNVIDHTKIDSRILWIHGEVDHICPAAAIPVQLREDQLVLIPRAGHAPFLTEPQTVYEHIHEWISTGSRI